MFIPYNTDAPLYHWPVATVGVIVVNFLALIGMMSAAPESVDPFVLAFGDGLHPLQWATSLFLHVGPFHLLGNMLCLWGFGIVVEGKLGWWKFLLVYLGIGIAESAIEQVIMLGAEVSAAVGASGAIFGLLAICLVWAPVNEMNCLIVAFYREIFFEVSIWVLAIFAVALQIVLAALDGFSMGSAVLHLIGGTVGLLVGVAMVKLDWVDCEGWDCFSLWAKRKPAPSGDEEFRLPSATPRRDEAPPVALNRDDAVEQISRILAEQRFQLAYTVHRKLSARSTAWRLPSKLYIQLITGLCKVAQWREAIAVMKEYLGHSQDQAPQVRLKLAQVLVKHARQPAQALKVLQKIPANALTDSQQSVYRAIGRQAQALIDEGVMELKSDDV